MENCSTGAEGLTLYELSLGMIVAGIALGCINLVVLLGNSLVIVAVIRNRKLRTVTNIYIVSLACADMLLAIFVLPFSAALEVLAFWPFGKPFCTMWLAIDVLLCTASILNLCAISLDRFLAVTLPIRYPSIVSKKRGKILVMLVWVLSFVISFPPLIGWNDENNGIQQQYNNWLITQNTGENYTKGDNFTYISDIYNENNTNDTICVKLYPECQLTPTRGYRIYAALGSFYIPMFVMVFFYCRIYRAATRTAASLRTGILMTKRSDESSNKCHHKVDTIAMRVHRGGGSIYRSPSTMSNRRASYLICRDDKLTNCNGDIELLPIRNRSSIACNNNNKRSLTHNYSDPDLRNGHFRQTHRCTTDPASDSVAVYLSTSPHPPARNLCPESPYQHRKLVLSNRNFAQTNRRHRSVMFFNDGQPAKINLRKFVKETKAAKTVAIIVGAFILCWFPFFTIYLIGAFCPDCVPELAFSICFWLGYCNSMINPFIYALFSRDFRCAFRRILHCRRLSRSSLFGRQDLLQNNKQRMFGTPVLESESYSDF